MTSVQAFLGETAAGVIRSFMNRGISGIRIQNVTEFDPIAMLGSLNAPPRPRVAVAGVKIRELAVATNYPAALLTSDLAQATEWRNDPDVIETVVIVSFGEGERLGSFHRFAEVRDRDLYSQVCETAQREICPNDVLKKWWTVLARPDVRRQISVYRLAGYFLFVKAKARRIPEASRDGLYLLGLVPSNSFFDYATPVQLFKNLQSNRLLANRIEILSNSDRDRLNRTIEAASTANRQSFQETLGKILKYNRSGSDPDRAKLTSEGVRALFDAKKASANTRPSRTVNSERAGVDAILAGDDDNLEQIGKKVREAIDSVEDGQTPTVTFELAGRDEQIAARIPAPLVKLLLRSITPDYFGGRFKFPDDGTFDESLTQVDNADFAPFVLDGEKSFTSLLGRVVNAGLMEPEVIRSLESFVSARKRLANNGNAVAIEVSPLVILASDKGLLQAGKDYLEAYEALTGAIRERYEFIASESSVGARNLCAQLLVLDTIYLETPNNVFALLSPLHPLHIWKYLQLATQMVEQRETLAEEQRDLLGESAAKLPHFVTALFVPEGLLSQQQSLVLPESHQVGTLPCYQKDNPHYAGNEGQDRLLRILQKFLVLYPHAKRGLRVCLVDPPALADLLETLATQIATSDLPIDGIELTVWRTLDRPLSLGMVDEQLETIASIFAAEDSPRFVLDIHRTKTTHVDVLGALRLDPVHVLGMFDPSRSEVGRFSNRESGFLHPLVLPKEFHYDSVEDTLVITPAASGDLFDDYYSLQNRLNNSLTGSHFGISSSLAPHFPQTGEWLRHCTWLVLGDRLMDALPTDGGHVISFEPGLRRDIVVMAESLTKFERAFDYYLRKANLDPSEDSLRELITSSAELVGEGLLGLIRPDAED